MGCYSQITFIKQLHDKEILMIPQKTLESHTNSAKVSEYKTNTQKSMAFVYTNNKQLKMKLIKQFYLEYYQKLSNTLRRKSMKKGKDSHTQN